MARVVIDLRNLELGHPNATAINAHNLAAALLRRGDHEYRVLEPGARGRPPQADVNLLPGGGRPRFGLRNVVLVPELDHLLSPSAAGPLKVLTRSWQAALTSSRADLLLAPSVTIREALLTYLRVPAERVVISPPGLEPGFARVSLAAAGAARESLGIPRRFVVLFGTDTGPALEGWGSVGRERTGVALIPATGLPVLEREELRALLSGAVSCAYCGVNSGVPLGPLEAMACGSPPIVIGDAAYPEVVRDGGLVVRPDNAVGDWRDAFAAVLRSPRLRADLSQRARSLAEVFTADRSARLLAPLLSPEAQAGDG